MSGAPPPEPSEPKRPWRWHRVYFLLAAFDLATVVLGLALNHRMAEIYTRGIQADARWAERLGNYAHIVELLRAANAPANDVLDSMDTEGESKRLTLALQEYETYMAEQRREAQLHVAAGQLEILMAQMDHLDEAMNNMCLKSSEVFLHLALGQPEDAARVNAVMDRQFAQALSILDVLRTKVQGFQRIQFQEQVHLAQRLRRYEYALAFGILAMVAGATWYGRRLAQEAHALLIRQRREKVALKRAKEAAEAAHEAKRQFLSNMSHELRTPLNGVLGNTQLMLMTNLDARQRRNLENVQKCSEDLLKIITDILDMSQAGRQRIILDARPMELRLWLESTLAPFARAAALKGLAFSWHLAPEAPARVLGDPQVLAQCLGYLVDNALKFTGEGQVEIRVEPCAEAPNKIRFSVRDSGIGIEAGLVDRMFQPFTQADESNTRVYGGTGLGLALAKERVHALDGDIGVFSNPGGGATFWFTAVLPSTPAEDPVHPRPASLLLVEDDIMNQEVAKAMLTYLGHRVRVATQGREALDAMAVEPFDLVLMDCQMPVMDGYETTRQVRAAEASQGQGRHIPILAVTAHAREEDRQLCLACGMDDHLTKPLDLNRLEAALARWLPHRA